MPLATGQWPTTPVDAQRQTTQYTRLHLRQLYVALNTLNVKCRFTDGHFW